MNEFLEETELVKGLRAEVEKLKRELENRHQLKMYVWTDLSSFLAVAHAKSVKSARELLFTGQYIGESGDGSCPERDRARRIVASENPSIWIGENAEFCLSDNAELREQEAHSDTLFKRASAAEAERDQLKLELDRLQAALRREQWRPIDEAPKDGTPIDLWVTFPTRPEIQPQRYTDCFWEKELNRWNCVHGYDACFVPTHYRELPEPPEVRR